MSSIHCNWNAMLTKAFGAVGLYNGGFKKP